MLWERFMPVARVLVLSLILVGAGARSWADSLYFTLPAPLNDEDIEYIAHWLRLSEAQQAAYSAMLARYRDGHQSLFDDRISKIRRLADEGGALLGRGYSAESFAACERFFKEQEKYIEAMAALDTTMLAELATILGESQLPLHHHVELWRQRRRCLMAGWDLRSAGADLELLALKVFAKKPAVLDMVREPLIAYAEAVTARYVGTDRAALGRSLDGVRIMADASIAPEQKAAAMKTAFAAVAQREIELARLNAEHVRFIKAALPPPIARQFGDAYLEEVLPLTYPDLPVSEGYTGPFLASETLAPDQRADIESRWKTQAAALERLTIAMAEQEQRWNEHVTADRTFDGAKDFAESMRNLRLQRWLLHQQYLEQLLALYASAITPNQVQAIRGSINDIGVLINQAKDDHYPLR